MAGHKGIGQVSRLEVVDLGRRRRWSDDEKVRIVEESYSAPRLISATARRHGISRTLLKTWRKLYETGELGVEQPPAFSPVLMAPGMPEQSPPAGDRDRNGRIEIVLGNGRRVLTGTDVELAALVQLVEALDRR